MSQNCLQTGHEHSYSRTHQMTNYPDHTVGTTMQPYPISQGTSLLWVSGVAGRGVRPCLNGKENDPWWGSALCSTSTPHLRPGVLFCTFNSDGNSQDAASCRFEQIQDNEIRDRFEMRSEITLNQCCPDPLETCRDMNDYTQRARCDVSISLGSCLGNISCTCSPGEICQNQLCECDRFACEGMGRVCSDLGCVFADNPYPQGALGVSSQRAVIISTVLSVFTCVLITLAAIAIIYVWKKKKVTEETISNEKYLGFITEQKETGQNFLNSSATDEY